MTTSTALRKRVALLAAAAAIVFSLSGCGFVGGNEMNSDEARKQLITAVEAVQGATGTNWVVEVEPGIGSCSRTHGQWTTTWNGEPTQDRDTSYATVRQALESAGFRTYIHGEKTRTPVLSAQTDDGFGLDFSQPVEDGPIGFDVSSDCFLEEE